MPKEIITSKYMKMLQKTVKSIGKILLGGFGAQHSLLRNNQGKTTKRSKYNIIVDEVLKERLTKLIFKKTKFQKFLYYSDNLDGFGYFISRDKTEEKVSKNKISDYKGLGVVVDPICGGLAYARGLAVYALSVCVIVNGRPQMSVVYQPNLNEMFYTIKGEGAYLNGQPIHPSKHDDLKDCFVSLEQDYFNKHKDDACKIANTVRKLRTASSTALDLCYVAAGRLDAAIKTNKSYCDYLAAALILQEADTSLKLLTDFKGEQLSLKHIVGKVNSFIATNSFVTDDIVKYTKKW